MVYASFSQTAQSAGAMDGWHPKELAYLSRLTCEHIATLLRQIEEGAPWPDSALHARRGYELQTTHHNLTALQILGYHAAPGARRVDRHLGAA